jgi:hypothetical protein
MFRYVSFLFQLYSYGQVREVGRHGKVALGYVYNVHLDLGAMAPLIVCAPVCTVLPRMELTLHSHA